MIRITPEIERASVVFYTIVGADGQAAHSLRLIIVHAHVAKWDQPGISVK
jgi:hypothetical protein